MNAKIAILVTDGFEDSEYTKPVSAFTKEGYEIINIGLTKDTIVKGKKQSTIVKIDKSLNEAKMEDYNALFIPGGNSPDKLRAHESAVNFTRNFVISNKPVFSICHGPQLLITANVLRGRKATGYKSIKQDIINAGAEFIDNEVVIDDNLIFSRNSEDSPAFINAAINKLKSLHLV